jgi:hypothetical protein
MEGRIQRLADRLLQRLVPHGSAAADDCSYQHRCVWIFDNCSISGYHRKQERVVCAGNSAPSYGPWYNTDFCC